MLSRFASSGARVAAALAAKPALISGAAVAASRHVQLAPAATFMPLRKMGALARVPKSVVEASESLENEVRNFNETKDDLDGYLQDNAAKLTRAESTGDLTLTMKRNNYDVTITFNMEFEYPEERENEDEQEYQDERDYEAARGEDSANDEDQTAFHRLQVSLRNPDGVGFKAAGTVNMKGEFIIDSVTPVQGTTEFRLIAASDLSEASLEHFEIALEELALDASTCDFIVKAARQHRVADHTQSLKVLGEFFKKFK